jgi:hypothetical protein
MARNPFLDAARYLAGSSGSISDPSSPGGGGGPGYWRLPTVLGTGVDQTLSQAGLHPAVPANRFDSRLTLAAQNRSIQLTPVQIAQSTPATLPPAKLSNWQIVDFKSYTASGGPPALKIDGAVGYFTMFVKNTKTGESLVISGAGAGGGGGVGLLPVDVSGDPPELSNAQSLKISLAALAFLGPVSASIVKTLAIFKIISLLPSWHSPIYLGATKSDSDGADLFSGMAAIQNLSAGAGVEGSVSSIVFLDGSGPKAYAYLAGFDFLSNVSIGAGALIYHVTTKKTATH